LATLACNKQHDTVTDQLKRVLTVAYKSKCVSVSATEKMPTFSKKIQVFGKRIQDENKAILVASTICM